MLTVIETWTCAKCGRVEMRRGTYREQRMQVCDFPLPYGWQWVSEGYAICDQHVLTISDKPTSNASEG